MWLPTPSDEAIERFRELVLAETGMDLTPEQARDSATRFLQLHFITAYHGDVLRDQTSPAPQDRSAERPSKRKRGRPRNQAA